MKWFDAVANIAGGLISANAAKKSAKQQANALNKSNDLAWNMYQQNRADTSTARNLGNAAMNRLASGFGWTSFNPQKAAQQDTIPAMINPGEFQKLKAMGGAGVRNPWTGFFHFYDPDAGGDDSGGDYGGQDNEGGRSLGGFGDGGDGMGSARESIADAADALGGGTTARDSLRKAYSRGGFRNISNFGTTAPTAQEYETPSWDTESILRGPGTYDDPTYDGMVYGRDWGKLVTGGIGMLAGIPGSEGQIVSGWQKAWRPGELTANGFRKTADPRGLESNSRGNDNGTNSSPYAWGNTFNTSNATPEGYTPTTYGEDVANQIGGYGNSGDVLGDFERGFQPEDLMSDPSYAWRWTNALNAMDKSAAAKGTLFSGQYVKDLNDYIQGQASQEYANAWNRYQIDRGNKFNMLASLAGLGQTATGQSANSGANTASLMGSNYAGIGNANAAGTVGQANALTNTLNGWQLYKLLGAS